MKPKFINYRSNEALSQFDDEKDKETTIENDVDNDLKSDFDSCNYLTWKNFNHNPTPTKNNLKKSTKINLDEEINQLKLKFRNQYVCDDYSVKQLDQNDIVINNESISTPNTPLLYSYTLPKSVF